jgi:hypothetical protein
MNTQHTPGPWKPRSYPNAQGDIWIDCEAYSNEKLGTGPLGGTLATAHRNGTGNGSADANARLIAAAPDLLEALVEMMREYEPLNEDHAERSDAVILARAAIAKAKGTTL